MFKWLAGLAGAIALGFILPAYLWQPVTGLSIGDMAGVNKIQTSERPMLQQACERAYKFRGDQAAPLCGCIVNAAANSKEKHTPYFTMDHMARHTKIEAREMVFLNAHSGPSMNKADPEAKRVSIAEAERLIGNCVSQFRA